MTKGRYGFHGGQYIPEVLMNAVIELEQAYEHYKNQGQDIQDFYPRGTDFRTCQGSSRPHKYRHGRQESIIACHAERFLRICSRPNAYD